MRWIVLGALAAMGCRNRVDAPTEMEDVARYIYAHYDDDAELEAGLDNLIDWVEANLSSDQARRGYRLSRLSEEDTLGVEHAGRDHSTLLGAAVLAVSPFGPEPHAQTMIRDDQIFLNPQNYAFYEREVESDDLDAFLMGSGRIDTTNDIQTQSFGIRIPYVLQKDYRWVEGDWGQAIVARANLPEPGCNEGGGNCLMQSFADDIWIVLEGRPDTIRFTATWNEVVSPATDFITEEQQINALAAGMVNVFEKTDAFLADGGLDD